MKQQLRSAARTTSNVSVRFIKRLIIVVVVLAMLSAIFATSVTLFLDHLIHQ